MIALDSGDKIRGDASAATVVDYTIHGLDGGTIKQLADGQLADAIGDLFTADSADVVTSIILVNTDSSARTVNLYLTPSGGTARRLIAKDTSLGVGYSLHFDGAKVSILNPAGGVVSITTYGTHASVHENGGADEISVTALSGLLADDQHVLDAEVKLIKLDDFASPEDNIDLDAAAGQHGLMPKNDKVKLDAAASAATASALVIRDASSRAKFAAPDAAGDALIKGTALTITEMPANVPIATITFIIDGGGSAITTGIKGALEIPFACTINRVTLLADQAGSIVIDIWKQAYADYPPEDANSITASAPPTLDGVDDSQDDTLTDWTTAIAAGDCLIFNVDSVATVTWVTLSLKVTKT